MPWPPDIPPVTDPVAKLLAVPMLFLVIGVLLVVESIFMVESFTTILEITIGLGGTVSDAATLVVLKAPEILDFAIPIALLIGVYFAVTRLREEWAFVIFAATGVSWVRLPVFAALAGTIGGAVSLGISGYLAPEARHYQRLAVFDMHARNIVAQLTHKTTIKPVQELAGTTFISTKSGAHGDKKTNSLFIYHPNKGGNWHVSLADDWTISGPEKNGEYVVKLRNFRDYTGAIKPYGLGFDDAPEASALGGMLGDILRADKLPKFTTILVKNTSVEFDMRKVLGKLDQNRRLDELALGDLAKDISNKGAPSALRLLAGKIARALLAPFAALAALLAATVANGAWGRMTALPLAAIGVLGVDVLGRGWLHFAAGGGVWPLAAASALLLGLSLAPVIWLIARFGEHIILPYRDKTG